MSAPPTDIYRDYHEDGNAIARGVVDVERIDRLLSEADRLHGLGRGHRATAEDGPVKWLVVSRPGSEPVLRGLQYGYRISAVLDALRTSREIGDFLFPLLGSDISVVVNALFWKPPGERETAIAYHQDAVFRKPAEAFRNLSSSFVQFGLALDPHGAANGGMKVVARSHRLGDLEIKRDRSVMLDSPDATDLNAYGLSNSDEIDIELAPGDAVFWHPYLLHGSPPNASPVLNRRFLVTGYMRSADSDVGDASFRDGKPCPWQSPP